MKNKHQKLQGTRIKTFSILKSLGDGAWAVVYEAIDERDGSRVAVKAIPKIFMKQTPKLEQLVQTEIKVLRQCKNENVIRFVDSFTTQSTVFIIIQYCNGGDLEKYLDNKKRLTQDQATTFLKQILNGFKGLHEVNAMHRDFKVANVLLHQGICKIADLGFAKQMEKNVTKTILGTSLTMAPELLEQKPYGFQADLWSVGVVYYQLMYGKYPYMGMNDFEILKKIKKSRPDFTGMNISEKARDFIEKCLTINPKERISWKQVYDHPLIKQQEKIIYGLTSKLKINDNRNFYERDIKIDETLIYAERNNNQKKTSWDEFKQENVQQINLQKLLKENDEKKKIDSSIERYQKIYLNKRNNIMFIFKYVTPYVYNFANINANHGITLFIISKMAYLEMKALNNNIQNKVNFMKLDYYFKEFTDHFKYKGLIQLTKSDLDMIMLQACTYREDIYSCSNEIKKEFDLDKIAHSKWRGFVEETINSYEFQLSEALDQLKGRQKTDLIKVIQALNYFKENSQNADIEKFDKKIQSTDFSQAESKIKSKLQSLLKWD